MTEVNGLRLAYRGLIAGLEGGYVWAAIAMTLGAIVSGDPLRPLRPLAMAITPPAGSAELAFVLGLAAGAEAAKSYQNNPVALQLRAMNILYEGIKEKGAMVIVPSSVVETMGLGGVSGLASLASNLNPNKD